MDEEFRLFVQGAQRRLVHLADLLSGDRGRAEDLVQHALTKTYLAWDRVSSGDPEAYARTIVVHANIDWWRRGRWRERPSAALPERAAPANHETELARRDAVQRALAGLTQRERTVVVLRYYADLSEQETARELGCAVGTVKSTAARAFAKLRESPHLNPEVIP